MAINLYLLKLTLKATLQKGGATPPADAANGDVADADADAADANATAQRRTASARSINPHGATSTRLQPMSFYANEQLIKAASTTT